VCGCSTSGHCKNCNSSFFIGYDMFNSGRTPQYTLINSTAPNTNDLTCTNSNVEIQVRKHVKNVKRLRN